MVIDVNEELREAQPELQKRIIGNFDDIKELAGMDLAARIPYLDEVNKNYYLFGKERDLFLREQKQDWRSNAKSLVTKMFVDRIHNMVRGLDLIMDFVNTNPDRSNDEKEKIAEEMMIMYGYLKRQDDFKQADSDVLKDAIKDGFGIFALDFINVEIEKKFMYVLKGDQAKKTADGLDAAREQTVKYVTRRPVLRRVSWYNFYMDYYAVPGQTRFVIERMLCTDDEILDAFSKYPDFVLQKVDPELDAASTDFLSYTDYEARKNYFAFTNFYKIQKNTEARGGSSDPFTYTQYIDIRKTDEFNLDAMFSIAKHKKLREVILVSNEDQLDIWINGIRHGSHQLLGPIHGLRYQFVRYRKIEGSQYATGVGHVCLPIQHTTEVVENSRIDSVKMSVNKNFIHRSSSNSVTKSMSSDVGYTLGKIHRLEEGETLEELRLTDTPPSAYRESEAQFMMLQGALGVGFNVLGMQNKVERVAGIAQMLEKAADEQSIEFVDSYLDAQAWIAKNSLLLAVAYMSQEQFDKILGKGNILSTLTPQEIVEGIEIVPKRDDLKSQFDAVRSQMLLNFMRETVNLRNVEGLPLVDFEELVTQIAETLGLNPSLVLSSEEIQKLKEEAAQQQPPQPEGGGLPEAAPDIVEQMRALQGLGAAIPAEMTTNAQGANQFG